MLVSKQHPNKALGETPWFSQTLFLILMPFSSANKAVGPSGSPPGTRGRLEAGGRKRRLLVSHGQEGQGQQASARERPGRPLEKGLPGVHATPYPAHLCTTPTNNWVSLPGTLPGSAMKVLHAKKLFRPRQPGPFGDPTITGLWFFSLLWSEGRLPALAGPGGGHLWPSVQWPVSRALQATSP